MKIAFVLTQSLESPSGLGRFGPLARELTRLGHRVEVLALHPDWARLSPRRYVAGGVQVAYVGQMHVLKRGARKSYFGPGRLLTVALAATLQLARALARSDAEVVQLGKPHPMNLLAARLAGRGRPLYCDCDDYEAATNRFGGAWQRRVVRHFEDGVVQHAAGLTVNTRFTYERYRRLGYPAERLVYVPNGVERARFAGRPDPAPLRRQLGLAPDEPVVVYVGTLSTHSHACDLLLAAFRELRARLHAARLLLVGGGEDYDALRAQAARLGLGAAAIFAGPLPPAEVPACLALATVSVDPVHDDPVARARSPLKVVESLAAGVPVVTGDVGDRRATLADGRCGVLVRPGDAAALADGLLALLEDPARRARLAAAALEERERWYWDRLAPEFARVYDLSAGGRR